MEYLNFSWVIQGSLAGAAGPRSRRDLVFLQRNQINAVLRMDEQSISVESYDMVDFFEPVPDGEAPRLDQIERMVNWIDQQLEMWERTVAVTCGAGLGRTGTALACYLVFGGYKPEDAMKFVRDMRPGSIETPEQEQAVRDYGDLLKSREREMRRRQVDRL